MLWKAGGVRPVSPTEPKSLGLSAPLGPPLKATGNPPPIGPAKGCPPLSAPLMAGGACEVSTGRITRCTVLPSVTSAWQRELVSASSASCHAPATWLSMLQNFDHMQHLPSPSREQRGSTYTLTCTCRYTELECSPVWHARCPFPSPL